MPMDIDSQNTPQPGPSWRRWLAGNRKLAILSGLSLVLLGVAGVVLWQGRSTATDQNSPTNTSVTNGSSGQTGSTFERFQAIVNRPAANTNTTTGRPTKEDTAKAIQQLTNSNQ